MSTKHSYRLRFTENEEKQDKKGPFFITLTNRLNGTIDVLATGNGDDKKYDEKEDTVMRVYNLIAQKYQVDFFKLRIMDPELYDQPLPDTKIPVILDDDLFEQSVKDIVEGNYDRELYKWNVGFESTVFHYLPNYLPSNRAFYATKVHSHNTRHQENKLSSAYDHEMSLVETPLPKRNLTLDWFVDDFDA